MNPAAPISGPAWLVAVTSVIGVILLAWALRKPAQGMLRMLRKAGWLIDDFAGEPAHDGQPGRPGAMARLSTVEAAAAETGRQVAEILAEISPNNGHSMKDATHRIDGEVRALRADIGDLRIGMGALWADLNQVREDVDALKERSRDG